MSCFCYLWIALLTSRRAGIYPGHVGRLACLGFGSQGFASVSRDRCGIFLCVGDQGHPGTWVWIGSGDIEPLCDKFRAEGAKVRHPPTNYQWAYETQIEDPDGNVLRFGSDPKPDQPIGEWLDMHGTAWVKSPAGEESRVDCT